MKRFHLCLLFSLAVLTASSQKVYFVYIQTESEQPFFVKINEKVVSSTGSGYVILSKLVDSTYSFSIGFPQSKWPEQYFSVTLSRQDHGFLLKNFDEKGWGLFDLQSLAVQMSMTGSTAGMEEKTKVENKEASVFTDILSKAADDPSLKEKPVQPKVEEKKPEVKESVISKPAAAADTLIVKKEEPKKEVKEPVVTKPAETITAPVEKKEEPKPEIKEQPIVPREEVKTVTSEPYKPSLIKKWSESSTTDGFGLVFIDDYENGIKDTIRLVIPNPKPVVNVVKEEPKEEKKFLEITTEVPKKEQSTVMEVEKPVVVKPVVSEQAVEKTIVKNNCSEEASESDFLKLRKKMAGEAKEESMISEARKIFKTKCFSTNQVKNLSTLFLTDEGKYNFFDMAYKYVSDMEVYSSLQAELKDEYYRSRFKAMLRN